MQNVKVFDIKGHLFSNFQTHKAFIINKRFWDHNCRYPSTCHRLKGNQDCPTQSVVQDIHFNRSNIAFSVCNPLCITVSFIAHNIIKFLGYHCTVHIKAKRARLIRFSILVARRAFPAVANNNIE